MWIASTLGFYSIVQKDAGVYFVRGRSRDDLENLIEAAGLDQECEVTESERADYRYRFLTDEKGFIKCMFTLQLTVDYPNFKDEIKKTPDQKDKLPYYSRIWGQMAMYQWRHPDRLEGEVDLDDFDDPDLPAFRDRSPALPFDLYGWRHEDFIDPPAPDDPEE